MMCVLNTIVVFLSLLQSFSQSDHENFPTPFTAIPVKNAKCQNGRIPDLEIEFTSEIFPGPARTTMQHAKFQDHRTSGSGEEYLFKVFTIYGHGGHVTWTIYINFRSLFPRRLQIKFGFDWPSGFRGEDV